MHVGNSLGDSRRVSAATIYRTEKMPMFVFTHTAISGQCKKCSGKQCMCERRFTSNPTLCVALSCGVWSHQAEVWHRQRQTKSWTGLNFRLKFLIWSLNRKEIKRNLRQLLSLTTAPTTLAGQQGISLKMNGKRCICPVVELFVWAKEKKLLYK